MKTTLRGHRASALIAAVALPSALIWGMMPTIAHADETVTPLAATITESEPNETIQTASALPLGTTATGSSLRGGSSTNDTDYYAIDIPKDSRVTFDLQFPVGGGRAYDLSIVNPSGSEFYKYALSGGHANGTWVRNSATFLPAGRHYVRVYGQSGWETWGKQYSLTVTAAAGTVETEANDSIQTADRLPLGTTIRGSALDGSTYGPDNDYYAIDVPEDSRVTFDLQFPVSGGRAYDLSIKNPSGTDFYSYSLNGVHADGARVRGDATFLPAGRHYVYISSQPGWETWGKEYNLTVTATPGTVETEFNNSIQTADRLPLGTTIRGSSLNTSTYTPDYDYYAVDIPSPGEFQLRFQFPAGGGRAYDVSVYDAAAKQLYNFALNGSDSDGSRLAQQVMSLPEGRHYVRVSGQDEWETWGKQYSLSADRPARAPFVDVSDASGAWNYNQFAAEIAWLASTGVSTGWDVGGGKREYRPGLAVARDAMAAFLYRAAGSPAYTAPQTSPFTDVPTSHQFYKEIAWLASKGISTGWDIGGGKKEYRPDLPIARDAMAAFLYRFAGNPSFTAPAVSPFADVTTGQQFYKEIAWLASTGVSTGWDVGGGRKEYRALQPIARDAMAAFLYRFDRL